MRVYVQLYVCLRVLSLVLLLSLSHSLVITLAFKEKVGNIFCSLHLLNLFSYNEEIRYYSMRFTAFCFLRLLLLSFQLRNLSAVYKKQRRVKLKKKSPQRGTNDI